MKKEKKANFGTPFSKEWWGNIWYYHKGAILICSVFAVLITVTTMMLPERSNLDMSFLYLGNYKFNDAQRASIEEELADFAVDWNGDGVKRLTFATAEVNPFMDDDWNQEYTNLAKQLLDSSTTDLYLMDQNCLQFFKGREEWTDLADYADRYQAPEENRVYNDEGKLIGIKIRSHPLFENHNAKLEFYVMLADIRTVPVKGMKDGMHEQNITLLEYFLSEAQF